MDRARIPLSLGVTVALTFVFVAEAAAQVTPSSRIDTDGNLRESAYLRMPIVRAEDQKYAVISGDSIKAMVHELVEISRAARPEVEINGNRYWGRISGTRGEELAREWVEARFRELGLEDIRLQEFDLTREDQWYPEFYDVSVEAGDQTYRFRSLVPALRSVPTDGMLDLEAVWVGFGSEADFRGRDVAGKAVFIHSIPAPGSMRHSAQRRWPGGGAIRRAAQKDAAAIFVVYGISDNWTLWQGLGRHQDTDASAAHRITEIEIPGFFMGYEDGLVVRDLIGAGESIRVKARLDVGFREGGKTANVYGTLPGVTDEEIYILAHLDGYKEAASDNASGVAVMIGLAEYFSRIPREQRRRNLVFVGTAGHHVGSPGSQWLRDNFETALANAVLMINAEHISLRQSIQWGSTMRMTDIVSPSRWWVGGSERLVEIVLDAYRTFGVGVWDHMEGGASGEMGAVARFLPSVQIIRSPEIKHTDQDLPEWVPAVGLEATARAYAKIIDQANELNWHELGPPANPTLWRPYGRAVLEDGSP